ncbi:MAG: hypothetical protein ABFD80_05995, partial [Acidobacteriota bacterium]
TSSAGGRRESPARFRYLSPSRFRVLNRDGAGRSEDSATCRRDHPELDFLDSAVALRTGPVRRQRVEAIPEVFLDMKFI